LYVQDPSVLPVACISMITTENADTDTSIANRVTAQTTDLSDAASFCGGGRYILERIHKVVLSRPFRVDLSSPLPCISVITTDNTDTATSIANRVTAQATDPFRCSKLLRRQLLYYSKGSTSCIQDPSVLTYGCPDSRILPTIPDTAPVWLIGNTATDPFRCSDCGGVVYHGIHPLSVAVRVDKRPVAQFR
jgi:hypothetical protein